MERDLLVPSSLCSSSHWINRCDCSICKVCVTRLLTNLLTLMNNLAQHIFIFHILIADCLIFIIDKLCTHNLVRFNIQHANSIIVSLRPPINPLLFCNETTPLLNCTLGKITHRYHFRTLIKSIRP